MVHSSFQEHILFFSRGLQCSLVFLLHDDDDGDDLFLLFVTLTLPEILLWLLLLCFVAEKTFEQNRKQLPRLYNWGCSMSYTLFAAEETKDKQKKVHETSSVKRGVKRRISIGSYSHSLHQASEPEASTSSWREFCSVVRDARFTHSSSCFSFKFFIRFFILFFIQPDLQIHHSRDDLLPFLLYKDKKQVVAFLKFFFYRMLNQPK